MSEDHLCSENAYCKTGLWVSVMHVVGMLLIIFWAVFFVVHPEPIVMMAEMVDRESSALVQTIKNQAVRDRQEKKNKLAPKDNATAQEQAASKNVNGDPAAAPVHMPDAGASDLHNPKPPYPAVSRSKGEQGVVLLKVCVAATGAVDSVDLAKTSGFVRLDRAASDTVERWRFHPARKGGQPIPMCYQLPIRFSLDQSSPAGAQ